MYDPLIVDTFLKVHEQLASEASGTRTTTDLELIALAGRPVVKPPFITPPDGLNDIVASTEEMLALYDLAQGLMGRVSVEDAADIISKHLRRIVPASTCVLFLYEQDRDELVVAHASGECGSQFTDLRIPRGQRLTGWVAANKQSILNSDPVLDLGEAVLRHSKPRLRSCLSTPLISNSHLVGVLTVYSTIPEGFTEDHRRLLEVVGTQVSETIRHAGSQLQQSVPERVDRLRLPRRDRVERFVEAETARLSAQSVVSVVQIHFNDIAPKNLTSETRQPLELIVEEVSKVLRGADVLCRYSDDELVVVLTQTDPLAGATVAARITEVIDDVCRRHPQFDRPSYGVACAPEDGLTLAALVKSADRRRNEQSERRPSRHTAIH
jgi:diguanylate cyclase (GGDEF)-like protein